MATSGSPLQLPATWSATARGYAEDVSAHSVLYAEEALRRLPLRASDQVLDVATGTGALAFLAARLAKRVAAVDFAPGMIDELERRIAREGVTNVEGAVMDAQALAFADASFDAVFCLFGAMFFPDRATAFAEMRRVLRPGGQVLVASWAPIARRPLMQLGFESLAEALPDLPPPQKGDLQTLDDCERELGEVGFLRVSAQPFSATRHVESAEQYVRVMERSGAPFVALKKKLGEEAWAQAEVRLLEAVRRRLPEGSAELGAEALLTVGTR